MADVTIYLKDTDDSVDVNVEWGGSTDEPTPAQQLAAIMMAFLDRVEEVAQDDSDAA